MFPPRATRPRILHLISHFEPGGAERQASYLLPELAEQGWDVHVGYLRGGPNLERVARSRATLHRLQASGNYDLRLPFRLSALVEELRPSLIQTWLPQMDILGCLAAGGHRVPWILSERSSSLSQGLHPRIRIRAALARRATAIIANSPDGSAYWRQRTGRAVEHVVIPNSLALEEIRSATPIAREEFGIPNGTRILLHIGRLVPAKNLPVLLHALSELFRNPQAVAVFCGDGPLRPALESLAEHLGVKDRVRFTGFTANVWGWLKVSDVVISVSRFEGQPNSILEALACARPLVVSSIPGHRHFLDERHARFVPTDDPQAIARGIQAALEDVAWRESQARHATALVEDFTIARMAEQYGAVYQRLLQRRPLQT